MNDGYFHGIVDVGKSISLVVNLESENTKSPRSFEIIIVGWGRFVWLRKCYLVIRIEHNELELYVIGDVRNPFSVLLSVNINVVLDVDLTFVILRVAEGVWLIANFIVSHVVCFEDTALLKVPFDHFSAQDKV